MPPHLFKHGDAFFLSGHGFPDLAQFHVNGAKHVLTYRFNAGVADGFTNLGAFLSRGQSVLDPGQEKIASRRGDQAVIEHRQVAHRSEQVLGFTDCRPGLVSPINGEIGLGQIIEGEGQLLLESVFLGDSHRLLTVIYGRFAALAFVELHQHQIPEHLRFSAVVLQLTGKR